MSRKISLHLVAFLAFLGILGILGHSSADAKDSPGKNLISSGGFEGPVANFPKWHTRDQQFENDGCIYCGPTTEMAFRGKQSCKIQTTGTRGDCLRYVCTNIKPGTAYRYEFHYQIKSGGIYISPEGGLPTFFRLEGSTRKWKKFSVVRASISVMPTPFSSSTTFAVWATKAGSLRLPRCGTGAR